MKANPEDRLLAMGAVKEVGRVNSSNAAPGTLHGVGNVATVEDVVWVDSLEALETVRLAGYPQAVCLVPDDANDIFAPLIQHKAWLATIKRFTVAMPATPLRDELARRLGRHRVWLCAWPDGCQHVCDTAAKSGTEAIRTAIRTAEPYPIEGVFRPTAESMLAYRKRPAIPVMTTGAEATDACFKLPTEGKLIIVTGVPAMGKSTYVRHIMCHVARNHGRRWAIFSPEMGEWQEFASRVIAWLADKHFRAMTDGEIQKWSDWCRSRFAYISCDSEDTAPTLDWLLDCFRICVLRDGVTDALLDPWNQIEHQRGSLSETDYIDQTLRKFSAFGRRHGCNIWVVAHPTKMRPERPGQPYPVPNLYDISGSAAFYNKADIGLTVHRTEGRTEIYVQKAKFERWQGQGIVPGDAKHVVKADLEYDRVTGRFTSAMGNEALVDGFRHIRDGGRWAD